MSTDDSNNRNDADALSTLQQTASSDLSSLNRVSHRLAMTESGEPFRKVLTLLLPRLLMRIGSNHAKSRDLTRMPKGNAHPAGAEAESAKAQLRRSYDAIHAKLVETLSHIMKRVRDDAECVLPCESVLRLLYEWDGGDKEEDGGEEEKEKWDPSVASAKARNIDPFTINLSLAFLTLGVPRCSYDDALKLLPGLIGLLGAQHRHLCLDEDNDGAGAVAAVAGAASANANESGDENRGAKKGGNKEPCYALWGVDHLTKAANKSRYQQASHLVLRALHLVVSSAPAAGAGGASGGMGRGGASASASGTKKKKGSGGSGKDKKGGKGDDGDDERSATTSGKGSQGAILAAVRSAIRRDPTAAAALYDLFLDVLLYRPMPATSASSSTGGGGGGVPPPGLSQSGHERLTSGSSVTHKDWRAEFATTGGKLKELKWILLDWIAPCRRWALFEGDDGGIGNVVGGGGGPSSSSAGGDMESSGGEEDGGGATDEGVKAAESDDDDDTEKRSTVTAAAAGGASSAERERLTRRRRRSSKVMGTARTVALLVVASGDPHADVAERAASYLKAHLDSRRNVVSTTTTTTGRIGVSAGGSNVGAARGGVGAVGDGSSSTGGNGNSDDTVGGSGEAHQLLGDPIALAYALLSLTLGDVPAAGALRSVQKGKGGGTPFHPPPPLGIATPSAESISDSNIRTVIMSTKRRVVADKTAAAILSFVSTKVLDDVPRIFALPSSVASMGALGSTAARASSPAESAATIGSLALSAANNILGAGAGRSESKLTSSAGSPRVAAARLLNSLCVRACVFYDAIVDDDDAAVGQSAQDQDDGGYANEASRVLHDLLARALSIACGALSTASSSHSVTSADASSIETRDACYGVVCTVARSRVATASGSMIFNCGGATTTTTTTTAEGGARGKDDSTTTTVVSIATAALLFGCASNEEETLRPRAVAALDALLGAYCRVYEREETADTKSTNEVPVESQTAGPINPWASASLSSDSRKQQNKKRSKGSFAGVSKSLFPLLWSASQGSQPKAARLAAARWSSELMKNLDLPNSCHMLCFLAGDTDSTSASIAKEGLGVASALGEDVAVALEQGSEKQGTIPDFNDLVSVLFEKRRAKASSKPSFHDFSPRGQRAALRFGLKCLLGEENLYGSDDDAVEHYLTAISDVLLDYHAAGTGFSHGRDAIDLLDECCICLASCLGTSQFARNMFASASSEFNHESIAKLAITANSSKARRHLAESLGHLYEDTSIWNLESTGSSDADLGAWVETCGIHQTMMSCKSKLEVLQTNLSVSGEVHGAAFVGSRCVRAFRLAASDRTAGADRGKQVVDECWELSSFIVAALGRGSLHSDEAIGNACSRGMAVAFSYDGVDAPLLATRLYDGTAKALKELSAALKKFGNGDHADSTRASSLARAAGMVLASSTSGAGSRGEGSVELGPERIKCVQALFDLLGSTSSRKDPEVNLVTGEALVNYADAFSPKGAVWTSSSPETLPDAYDETYASELPPHKHVLYTLFGKEIKASSPHKRTACAPALLALVGHAANLVSNDVSSMDRAFVKQVYEQLDRFQLAFVKLLGDPKSKQLSRESCCLGLAACYGLATRKDSSSDGFAEEEGDRASHTLNERLLRAFGQTTNFGGSAMMETRAQEAERLREQDRENGQGAAASLMEDFGMDAGAEVGGASGLGEAALGAYREMASAAASMERPDILYTLMILSVTHPVWFTPDARSRYNATSLLGREISAKGADAADIRNALRPHLSSLIPRLLRACHDPNKQAREQMTALWVSLTGGGAESRAAISQHLLTTIDTLTEDATNKLWRARVGACGALSEIIVGRSWEELGGGGSIADEDELYSNKKGVSVTAAVRLLRLWRVSVRSLDDVRLTVREAGESLARSVRSLTIRLCDPSSSDSTGKAIYQSNASRNARRIKAETTAALAASTALAWLVKHGLNQPCAEATGACVSCLLGIVDVARPATLQPVLPELVYSLSMSMSGLEPAALNYLQVRAAGNDSAQTGGGSYDRIERIRLQLAQSGPIAGALTKCLDMVRHIDQDAQKRIVPELDSALRCGAGFATRAAVADAVTSLCNTSPAAFKFSGSSTSNPTVRLLRALYFASERERGAAAKDKMTHALGSLAALAPGYSVRKLALRACEKYSGATGSNDDPAARRAAAAGLRSIAVRASSHLADGGSNNIWCARVLPMAFLGRHDEDAKVASLWKDVWEEGGVATNISEGTEDFGVLSQEKLLPYLVTGCVAALNDVSWSRRVVGCKGLAELADLNILAPAPRALQDSPTAGEAGRLSLARSRRRAQASSAVLAASVRLIVRSRVWAGKGELVKASVKVAGKWSAVGAINKDTNGSVWGWDKARDGDIDECRWVPVKQQVDCWDDLFVGDNWFNKAKAGEKLDSFDDDGQQNETAPQKEDKGESEEDTALNFEESDVDNMQEDEDSPIEKDLNADEPVERNETVTFSGFCRALLEQALLSAHKSTASEEALPYKAAALQGLSELLESTMAPMDETNTKGSTSANHARFVYRNIAPTLLSSMSSKDHKAKSGGEVKTACPPLLTARAIDCLASAMWEGIGEGAGEDCEDILKLSKVFEAGLLDPAWTVREASALCGASLAKKASIPRLRKHNIITTLFGCSLQTSKDRKFWRVRHAGLKLLHALVSRAGSPTDRPISGLSASGTPQRMSQADTNRQLLLEAMLPLKEKIMKLARASLTDSESKVTAVATDICSAIAWWP